MAVTSGGDGVFFVAVPVESPISGMVIAVSQMMEVGVRFLSSFGSFGEGHWSLGSLFSVDIWCNFDEKGKCMNSSNEEQISSHLKD